MANQESYDFSQGSGGILDVVVRDGSGSPVTGYAGTEPLTCVVWPGGNREVAFSPVASWTDASEGSIAITIAGTNTNALDPGRYRLMLRIDDGSELVDAYECYIEIVRSAGADVATASYTTYEDLETHGADWLDQVATKDTEAGFWEQQERALDWMQKLGHAHFTIGGLALPGCGGPTIVGGRSQWLQDQFDAGNLVVTPEIREACANYALYLVTKGKIGLGDTATQFGKLARMYKSNAEYIATTITMEIVSNSATVARISLGSCSPLYG